MYAQPKKNVTSICDLPVEVLHKIIQYLPVEEIHASLKNVNRHLQKHVETHCGTIEHLDLDISPYGKKALSKLRSFILRDRPNIKGLTVHLRSDKNPDIEIVDMFQSVLECLPTTLKEIRVANMGSRIPEIGSPTGILHNLTFLSISEMDAALWKSIGHLTRLEVLHIDRLDQMDKVTDVVYPEMAGWEYDAKMKLENNEPVPDHPYKKLDNLRELVIQTMDLTKGNQRSIEILSVKFDQMWVYINNVSISLNRSVLFIPNIRPVCVCQHFSSFRSRIS